MVGCHIMAILYLTRGQAHLSVLRLFMMGLWLVFWRSLKNRRSGATTGPWSGKIIADFCDSDSCSDGYECLSCLDDFDTNFHFGRSDGNAWRPRGGNRSKAWMEIPDLSGRPDEIGRLSSALRAMVTALYDRIDANERFATDFAHEIKNPLASLRAAVGAMAIAKPGSQRQELLDVIDHDVRRLDWLLSDISNASRLESDLVKEQEKAFELGPMIAALSQYLAEQAAQKGVELVTDLADEKITVVGLEERLAQVFVNLITNAISFCSFGGTIRFWARQRDNRMLIVVEDTGPGLSDDSLVKIFDRFYSDRPASDFGNHSGLGLAISKQIVEAHRGVVWAENIRPVDADRSVPSQGARFVVGLPI